MIKLEEIKADIKEAWVEFDEVSGAEFEVEIRHVPRTEVSSLVKECQETKYNRKSKAMETNLDEDKFIDKFVERSIKNWRGLTLDKVEKLVAVDRGENSGDTEIQYSHAAAVMLVKNNAYFDDWMNEVVQDLDNFRPRGE